MARIEWARLSGEDVEHVVSVMVARENQWARRIRPSRGDQGLDIVVQTPEVGTVDVYQVKSFALNLRSNEKRQIANSFDRLRRHTATSGLSVANWYLVLPLDPTPENVVWFDELTTGAGFNVAWRGLTYVDGLAAKYPDVIDYYLRDGKERLESAIVALTGVLRLGNRLARDNDDATGPLTPEEMRPGLLALHAELNRYDPHYRYDFSVDAVRPEVPDGALLVCAAQIGDEHACITFRVFARFAEATEERPVPIEIRWKVSPDSAAGQQLQDWITYGAPFEAPLGSADLAMDLPGGLGGDFPGAAVKLGPAEVGQPYKLRAEVVATSGELLATCRLNMNPVTAGMNNSGARASGQEENGTFFLELRFDAETQTAEMSLSSLDITGSRPDEVLPALRFLAAFHSPNTLRFALPAGPATHSGFSIPNDLQESNEADVVLRTVEALAVIQAHTAVQLVVPDLTEFSRREAGELVRAARLLQGETITGKWDTHRVRVDPTRLAAGEPAVTVMWREPFTVSICGVEVDLGLRQVQLVAVKIEHDESAELDNDGLVPANFHPLQGNRDVLIRHVRKDASQD